MPQGDQKDLKARAALREKILKLAKELNQIESEIASTLESQGKVSDDLVKKQVIAKKSLTKAQEDFAKGAKKAAKATKGNVKEAEKWANAIEDKVVKAQEEAIKKGKKLSGEFLDSTAHVASMGEKLIKATNDKGSAKVLEDFHGWTMQLEHVNAGLEEMSSDKIEKIQEKQREALKYLKENADLNKEDMKTLGQMYKTEGLIAKLTSKKAKEGKGFAKSLFDSKKSATALAAAISAVGAAMVKVASTAESIQTNLGTATEHSLKMAFSFKKVGLAIFGLNSGLSGARQDIALAASDINMMGDGSKHLAQNFAWAARNTGASTKTLAEMQEILMLNTDLSREGANQMIMGLEEFVREAGGIPKEVFDDIASSAEEIAKFTNGSADAIARAATMANKLGINLKTAGTMADSLLNLESSIASEFEASVLIGRELNFDKARSLALSNDLEGAMKAVIDQLGSEEEFLNMNAIQRQAMADSIGVSVDDMNKLIGYGAEGGGEVDPALKLQKRANKTLLDILFQLTPGGFGSLVSMLTKGLVGFLGFKAFKKGIVSGLKAVGVESSLFTKGFMTGIKEGIKNSRLWKGISSIGKTLKGWMKPMKSLGGAFRILGKLALFLGIAIDVFRGVGKLFGIGTDKTGEERKTEKKKGIGILVGGIIGGALGTIGGPVGIGIGAGIGAWIGEALAGMKMPEGLVLSFKNWFGDIHAAIKPIIDRITGMFSKFTEIFEGDGSIGEKVGKALGTLTLTIGGLILDTFIAIPNIIMSSFKATFSVIPEVGKFFVDVSGQLLTQVIDGVKGLGAVVIDGMTSAVSTVVTELIAFGKGLGTTIINGLLTGINNVIESIRGFDVFGYQPFSDMGLIELIGEGSDVADDFIWRPGSGIQKFSGDDTVVGLKDLGMLSQLGNGAASSEALTQQNTILNSINNGLAPLTTIMESNKQIVEKLDNLKANAGN